MALYGYARVSTAEQDFTLQEHALRAAGCEVIRAEKVSATRREGRTELALLLEFLRRIFPPALSKSFPATLSYD